MPDWRRLFLLEAVDLECVRGDRPLFSHLSFSLEPGELLHVTVAHGNGIQGDLTPAENLSVAVSLSGSADIAQIGKTLERLGLAAYHHFPAKILSQGQKRRLALARLVAEHKPLWILDEPLSGLDVDSASLMTTILMEHLAQGGLIIITSHQDINVETKTTLHIRIN